MALGSLLSGSLLQKKLMTPFVQMALGGFLVAVGLVVTFPPANIPFLYDNSPVLAFPGVFIAGVGDPMATLATLRCLYEMQVCCCCCVLTRKLPDLVNNQSELVI